MCELVNFSILIKTTFKTILLHKERDSQKFKGLQCSKLFTKFTFKLFNNFCSQISISISDTIIIRKLVRKWFNIQKC